MTEQEIEALIFPIHLCYKPFESSDGSFFKLMKKQVFKNRACENFQHAPIGNSPAEGAYHRHSRLLIQQG